MPLSLREKTIGDYLRPAGIRVALAGKTHVLPDLDGLERYGIEGGSAIAALMRAGRFEELDRYDGHSPPGEESGYAAYLRAQGYNSDDPWSDYVISADGPDGPVSGWQMRNVHLPARVAEEHSETAYMTREAMRFVDDMGDKPWFLHLSYVKPHWPYMAPAPYHEMYGRRGLPAAQPRRARAGRPASRARGLSPARGIAVLLSAPDAPDIVRPAYMGLIKQLDDWLGRLFDHLKKLGRFDDTLIVFTSDHGDFLGDHWLGEKEMFYEEAQRVPFIVFDPDPAADATRGTVDERFVEAVDVVPTCLEALEQPANDHLVEGRSLLPLLRGGKVEHWRDAVFSELDYSFREARKILKRGPRDCRAIMVRTDRWKYVWWQDFRPMLFDLANDPEGAARPRRRRRLRPHPPRDGGADGRLAEGAQDPRHGRRRLRRGAHGHAQEARHLLRRVVMIPAA